MNHNDIPLYSYISVYPTRQSSFLWQLMAADAETNREILGGAWGTLWKKGRKDIRSLGVKKTGRIQPKESINEDSQGLRE